MKFRNAVRVGLCILAMGTGLVQGHQYKWRLDSSCPACSCGSHCSAGTCTWATAASWKIAVCEPAFCNICDYTTYPDDSEDDATIENWTGTHTLELSTLTIDGLTIKNTSSTTTNITFESASSNNRLDTDFMIIDAQSGTGTITLTVQDGANITAA